MGMKFGAYLTRGSESICESCTQSRLTTNKISILAESRSRAQRSPREMASAAKGNRVLKTVAVGFSDILTSMTSHKDTHLFIMFNFFKDIPPQPKLPMFKEGYWDTVQAMQRHEQFLEGMLLKNIDTKPLYPYVHYAVFNTVSPGNFPSDPNSLESLRVVDDVIHDQTSNQLQGGFQELFTFIDPSVPLLPKRPNNENTAYLITAFKADGDIGKLDRTWSMWSGADYIVTSAPAEIKLQRLTFHKLSTANGIFTYVLMCEFSEALAHVARAKDFVEKVRGRECGYTSLYVIDHYF